MVLGIMNFKLKFVVQNFLICNGCWIFLFTQSLKIGPKAHVYPGYMAWSELSSWFVCVHLLGLLT